MLCLQGLSDLYVVLGDTRPLPGGTEVDKVLQIVTGKTLEMTGADLIVLALPGQGHGQLTIRHATGNGADRRQLPSVTRSLAPTSCRSPTRRG